VEYRWWLEVLGLFGEFLPKSMNCLFISTDNITGGNQFLYEVHSRFCGPNLFHLAFTDTLFTPFSFHPSIPQAYVSG
jgi:hypothetical protein